MERFFPHSGPESKLGKAGWRVKECQVLVATFRHLSDHEVAARLHVLQPSVQRLCDGCWATKRWTSSPAAPEPSVPGQTPNKDIGWHLLGLS